MKDLLLKLKPYRNGLGVLMLCIIAFFLVNGNPLHDFQLMSQGVLVQGLATEVSDFEDRDDNGNLKIYFFIRYEFTTEEGEKISAVVEVPGKSTERGFQTGQLLDIQYLTDSPRIHRIRTLISTTPTAWVIKYFFLGILTIAPGCYFLYRSYLAQRKTM